jgi:hypothetical protein
MMRMNGNLETMEERWGDEHSGSDYVPLHRYDCQRCITLYYFPVFFLE